MPYVFAFDHKHRRAPMEMKDLLGGKGANLAEMTSVLGLPVPPGFTITTDACRAYMDGGWPDGLDAEVAKHVAALEKTMGRRLGDAADPLLVSVRSGAKFSMPGMMDTVLNLGLNDESVEGLAKQTDDERFAFDSYRRFLAMYGRIVLGVEGEHFERLLETAKEWDGATTDADVTPETLRRLCVRYKDVIRRETGKRVPAGPGRPAPRRHRGGVPVVERRPGHAPTGCGSGSATTSAPRSTSRRWCSATATTTPAPASGFTRNAATGENKPYGDFLVNAQGEDVVAGIRNTEDLDRHGRAVPEDPQGAAQDTSLGSRRHYRDMCDTEFTIEQGKLWMLQTRVGKRTGAAALRMAVEMTKGRKWKISREEAIQRITEEHLEQMLHPDFAGAPTSRRAPDPRARRLARRRRRPGVLHRRRRRRRGRARREGDPRAQRDLAGGRPRDDGRRGHPHRPRRAREPRRRRRPRLGQARRRRRRGDQASRPSRFVVERRRRPRGRRASRSPGRSASSPAASCRVKEPEASEHLGDDPRLGRRHPAGARWRCGPTPTTGPTPPTPVGSAPRASACAGPSTCSSARTACRSSGA